MLEQMKVEQLSPSQSPESEIIFPQLPNWSNFLRLSIWDQNQKIYGYGENTFAIETERIWCRWYKRFQLAMQRLIERNVTADLTKEQMLEILGIMERLPSPPKLIGTGTDAFKNEIFNDWEVMTILKWRWDYGMSAHRAFSSIAEFEPVIVPGTEDDFDDVDLDATDPQEMCKWQLMCMISRFLPPDPETRAPALAKPRQVTEELQSPVTDIMMMVSDFESEEPKLAAPIRPTREMEVSMTGCKTMCLALRPRYHT